jgi:hypothetical protein
MQAIADNVFYDPASSHRWADLNETAFLERVFAELRTQMGHAFADQKFYVLSTRDGTARPRSAADPSPRKILIVISDESGSIPAVLSSHYTAIFKAYLPHELPGTNIFPFNVGYVGSVPAYPVKPLNNRPTTVFFSGNLSRSREPLYRALHPVYRRLPLSATRAAVALSRRPGGSWLLREDVSSAIQGSRIQFTRAFAAGLSPSDYGHALADTRIALCPRGASRPETFRHIGAMRAGAVILSEPLPATHFYRGAPVVEVNDWAAGIRHARDLIARPDELSALQEATIRWWKDVCSETATARYMSERLVTLSG